MRWNVEGALGRVGATRKMELSLQFLPKSSIPGVCSSSRRASRTVHGNTTSCSSSSERLGLRIASRDGQSRFQSSSLRPLVRKILSASKAAATSASSVGLAPDAETEEELSPADEELELDATAEEPEEELSPADEELELDATAEEPEEELSPADEELELDATAEEPEEEAAPTPVLEEEVIEFQLSGDATELIELNSPLLSIRTVKKVTLYVRDVGKQFVFTYVEAWVNQLVFPLTWLTMFLPKPEPEVIQLRTAMIEEADGVTAVQQWSATELTMQHTQLSRISKDIKYVVIAFSFFGWVRILEGISAVFSTNPPVFQRLVQSFYAIDYLTIAWLAYNLRKPFISILQVDPTDLSRVSNLRAEVWEALHAYFGRQWKLVATVTMVRFLCVVANRMPSLQWMNSHIKAVWDVLMTIPASVF